MAVTTSLGFSIFTTYKGDGARKAKKDLDSVADTTKDVGKAAVAAFGAATAAVGLWAASALTAGLASNALQQRTNMALETMLGSVKASRSQMEALREFAAESPISMPVWIRAQQQMLAFGIETGKVIPMLGAVQDAVVAAGGTEEEIQGAVRALSQMASKGKLSAEELNQLGERGIDAAGVVATAFGTTSADIRAQIEEGSLAVDDFFDGFIRGSEIAYAGAAENLRNTFTGTIDRLKGATRRIGEIFATPLVDPNGGGALVELGNAVADMMKDFENAARPFANEMSNAVAPAVDRTSDAIRDFGNSLSTEKLREWVGALEVGLPIISATGAALTAKLAAGALGAIPGLGGLAAAISPVAAGIAALAATSPELQSALGAVGSAAGPLIPVATDLALITARVLTPAVAAAASVLELAATVVEFLGDNILITSIVAGTLAVGVGVLTFMMGAAALGVTGLQLAVFMLRNMMMSLHAVLMANPFLAVATAVVALGAVFVALAQHSDAAAKANDRIQASLSNMEAGISNSSDNIAEDMDTLISSMEMRDLGDLGWESLDTSFSDLGKAIKGELGPATEDVEAFTAATDRIDGMLADMVLEGTSAERALYLLRSELGITDEQLEELAPNLDDFNAVVEEAESAQLQFEAATSAATVALVAQAEELRAQNDPLFALVKAQQDLQAAQDAVTEAINEYGVESDEAKAASLEAAAALLTYTDAGAEAAELLGSELTPGFLAAAEAAGFTDELVGLLAGQVHDATQEFQDFADDYEASVSVTGINSALTAAQNMQRQLDAIDRTVTISFEYENFTPINGIAIPKALGGPVVGPGTGTSDSIPARLSNGEFVVTASRVQSIGGFGAVEHLLRGATGYANGGPVTRARPHLKDAGSVRFYPIGHAPVAFHFHGPVADRRAAEDMVVQGYQDAVRKGRIPRR